MAFEYEWIRSCLFVRFFFFWWILRARKRMTLSKGEGVEALQRLADGLGVEGMGLSGVLLNRQTRLKF